MKLIIFDLDQTLVDAIDHNIIAFEKMFKRTFNAEASLTDIKFAGMTVPNIIREIGEVNDIPKEEIEKNLSLAIEKVNQYFKESIAREQVKILPGAEELLKKLSERGHALGLVTGNIEGITRTILEKSGLNEYFDIIVTGSESDERTKLVELAIKKAKNKFKKKFSDEEIVIIGDSIHDIESGKPFDALTIVVTTGFHSEEELLEYSPDYLFQDLTEPEILEILE
ncbi:MAG: HAD family hydrolase [Hadesarchaea archaeon]|nr:HAD family hydrolase [Hadesarchaea archaeon]